MVPSMSIHHDIMLFIPVCIYVLKVLTLLVIHALYIDVRLVLDPFLVNVRTGDALSTWGKS